MKLHIEQFMDALSEYDALNGTGESPLDILFYCYCVAVPQDDESIRKAEERLEPVMRELSNASSDLLFDRISEVCLAYQRAAFLDGIRCGAELSRALIPENSDPAL